MWKPPIVCHGTCHMAHNHSQRNTILDTDVTPMTEAQQPPDSVLAGVERERERKTGKERERERERTSHPKARDGHRYPCPNDRFV